MWERFRNKPFLQIVQLVLKHGIPTSHTDKIQNFQEQAKRCDCKSKEKTKKHPPSFQKHYFAISVTKTITFILNRKEKPKSDEYANQIIKNQLDNKLVN